MVKATESTNRRTSKASVAKPKSAKPKQAKSKQARQSKPAKLRKRCGWCEGDSLYISYHDEEWGVPLADSKALFALLQLEGMQAGLSWITILRKRAHMNRVFFRFSPTQLVKKGPAAMAGWLEDPGIIRNRAKLTALVTNAQAFLDYEKNNGRGSFARLLWSHVNHKPVQNRFADLRAVPAETTASKAMSKALKQLGFRFVGPTICYAFMQSAGMVNDHVKSCFRQAECAKLTATIAAD